MKKIELLAPAGDLEKLKFAIIYGADAVYFAGENFGLRAGASNFTISEMEEGISFAHERNKKVYITVNVFAHNEDIDIFKEYIKTLDSMGIDAFIVSDPGIFTIIKETVKNAEIHISTQANTTNYQSVMFWHKLGAKRIVLARELTFDEIRNIRSKIDESVELEAFVHGAMCISYSGRCLLSNFMTDRDANRGECSHPCRWKYALVEQKRPGEYYPIEENDRGTYIMNSRDLCMIEHIPELIESGISSAKIEGRMKSIFYVATVVSAYRKAIDAYYQGRPYEDSLLNELKKVSHREFTTGFFYKKPTNLDQNYQTSDYTRNYSFTGIVLSYDADSKIAVIEQRNKMNLGDKIEIFGPETNFFTQTIDEMYNADDEPISSAPHPQQIIKIKMEKPVMKHFMLRKEK